jgi:hypothetical protein
MAARTLRSLRVYLQTLSQQVLYPVLVICGAREAEPVGELGVTGRARAKFFRGTRVQSFGLGLSRAALWSSVSAGIALRRHVQEQRCRRRGGHTPQQSPRFLHAALSFRDVELIQVYGSRAS